MPPESLFRPSETLTFSASPEVWRLITDQWYGGRSAPFDMDVHKAAEKLMGDVDGAVREMERAGVPERIAVEITPRGLGQATTLYADSVLANNEVEYVRALSADHQGAVDALRAIAEPRFDAERPWLSTIARDALQAMGVPLASELGGR